MGAPMDTLVERTQRVSRRTSWVTPCGQRHDLLLASVSGCIVIVVEVNEDVSTFTINIDIQLSISGIEKRSK